jgi:MtN3 and saliva related transmembrane protein
MIWKIIGTIAACLTMFAFFPQIAKAIKTKSVRDVSLITIFQLSLGVSLWIIYGVYLKDAIIIVANAVTLFSMIILSFLYFMYERKKR